MNLNTLTPYYKVIADAQSRALDGTCYVIRGLAPTANGSGLRVDVAAGDSVEAGTPHLIYTGGNVTCSAAPTTASLQYRRDIVYRSSAGTLTLGTGTAALLTSTTPVPPALPASATLIAVIFIAPGQTVLTATDVEDCRQVRVEDQQALNVKSFGATGDGTTDDTAAIQAALTAAAGSGYFGGAVVYMPPGNYVIYSAGTECLKITGVGPVILRGAGLISTVLTVKSTVGASTDAIRIVGSTNALQGIGLEDFQIAAQSGTPGRHAVNIDTTTYQISRLRIYRVYLGPLGGKGISSTNPSLTDGFFHSSVADSVIYNGISLSRAGDSLYIERNTITGSNTGVDVSFVPGASAMVIRANNITTTAGGIHLGNDCTDTRIEDNFLEGTAGSTGSNTAELDIDGASGKVATNIVVRGNLIVPIAVTLNCIRVNYGDQVHISENTLIRPGVGAVQIITTANAKNTHIGHNNLSPTTDTLLTTSLTDAGANTTYQFTDYSVKQERTVRSMVRAKRTGNQLINNTTETAVLWDAEDFDTDSLHSTSSATSRLLAPYVGKYLITLTIQWESNAVGERLTQIKNQAGTIVAAARDSADTVAATIQTISTIYATAATSDYFEAIVYQSSGGNLNVVQTFGCSMSLAYLGD